jgi:hypothetical protein
MQREFETTWKTLCGLISTTRDFYLGQKKIGLHDNEYEFGVHHEYAQLYSQSLAHADKLQSLVQQYVSLQQEIVALAVRATLADAVSNTTRGSQ